MPLLRQAVRDFGTALKFDGSSSQYVNTGFSPTVTAAFSLSCWFNLSAYKTGVNNESGIFGVTDFNGHGIVAALNRSGGASNKISVGGDAGSDLNGTAIIRLGQWYHFAFVYTGTTIQTYINGVLDISASYSITTQPSNNLYLASISNAFSAYRSLTGLADDFRLFTGTALTQAQVQAIYYQNTNPSTPTGWWKFDEGTGTSAIDSGSGVHNGTITGATYSADVAIRSRLLVRDFGTSLSFGGVGSISVGTAFNSAINTAQAYTVSQWVKARSFTVSQCFIGSSLSDLMWFNWMSDGRLRVYHSQLTPSSTTTGNVQPMKDQQWHHCVATLAGGVVKIYIDGVIAGQQSVTGTLALSNAFYVGSDITNAANCLSDEAAVWSRALSAPEVLALYSQGTIPTGNILGYYKFDEGTDSTATDSSGNSNNGTITAATYSPDVVMRLRRTAREFGTSLSFNGSSTSVSIPANSNYNFGTGDFTVSCYIKTTSKGVVRVAVGKYSPNDWYLGLWSDNKATFSVASTAIYDPQTGTINDGVWHMLTGVRLGGNTYLYIDGVLRASTAAAGSVSGTEDLAIGKFGTFGGAYVWNGNIDDVRIYNVGLTAAQVAVLWNTHSSVATPIGYWKLDEGSGTTATDSSGNANNGTITAATYSTDTPGRSR